MSGWEILHGDSLTLMGKLEPATVDAIVTDPPYGLSFMGKDWDHGIPGEAFWREALRVAKPGAYLLAFGGTRTYHRLVCAIEDAGWDVRDCLMWLYGSGFPKSMDVAKAIDKAAGAERAQVRTEMGPTGNKYAKGLGDGRPWMAKAAAAGYHEHAGPVPVTEAAKTWAGWGTALKPAWEPICLARKPVAGTVAANVLAHGTGALNVDGCRVEAEGGSPAEARRASARRSGNAPVSNRTAAESQSDGRIQNRSSPEAYLAERPGEAFGRWPANLLLDEDAAAQLDAQSGETTSVASFRGERSGAVYGGGAGPTGPDSLRGYEDSGGASRFFYTAKASSGERHYAGRNLHPTVKPVELMRWLVRLVTPRGGLVLDPFMGSGSTGVAALAEGARFHGIEIDAAHVATARRRIAGPLFAAGFSLD